MGKWLTAISTHLQALCALVGCAIIGASLSEPHTYEENGGFVCLYIYIYIYISVVRHTVYFHLPDSCGHLNIENTFIVYAV